MPGKTGGKTSTTSMYTNPLMINNVYLVIFWQLILWMFTADKAASTPDSSRFEKAASISSDDITFNVIDSSYNVHSQTTPNKSYKVTATSCDCPDKKLRKCLSANT